MSPAKRRLSTDRFQRAMHLENRRVIWISLACICHLLSVSHPLPESGKIACTGYFGQLSGRRRQPNRQLVYRSDSEQSRFNSVEDFIKHPVVFFFPRKRALHFSSQEKFLVATENKIHFFLVGFQTDF